MNRTVGLISGSFDPMTNGHLWMINEGVKLFDKVHVVIASNPGKKSMFTPEERYDQVCSIVPEEVSVTLLPDNEFLVSYMKVCGITHMLRGIRNSTDFEYEISLGNINRELCENIRTIFIHPPSNLTQISSSLVKSMVGLNGWEEFVVGYVPTNILEVLKERVK